MLIPKQVKCIKSEGSFVTEHTYNVSPTGCVFWSSGNQSDVYWNDSMFEPIYTDEELLKYAAKMYPIGTKYKNAYKQQGGGEFTATNKPQITSSGNVEVGNGYVYYQKKNTWAEIIPTPKKVESFAIMCPTDWSTNPIWEKYMDWLRIQAEINGGNAGGGNGVIYYYGIKNDGKVGYCGSSSKDRIFDEIKPFEYIYELLNIPVIETVGEEKYLKCLDPWRSLVGYEVVNTRTGERSVIGKHGEVGAAEISSGKCIGIHNIAHPHSMVNKEWRVFHKEPTKETPLQRCNEIFKVGNIIRSVCGNKIVLQENDFPFYEKIGRVFTAKSACIYENGVYAADAGDTEPIKPEPKFKEGDFVMCNSQQHVIDFKVVGCTYKGNMHGYCYLLSSPSFVGNSGNTYEPFIYGGTPGTNTCWWAFEDSLTLIGITATDIPFESFEVSSTDNKSFIDILKDAQRASTYKQLSEMIRDSEDVLMWGKDKTDLLEVTPLRVSRKNIVK